MDNFLNDSRFSHIKKDARFKKIPRKERKVKIDKRFQSMFTDERFQLKTVVDKRGRPHRSKGSEHLEQYYDLSDDSSESDASEADKTTDGQSTEVEGKKSELIQDSFKSVKESRKLLAPEIKAKLKDLATDYARGEGRILSDSSSDEEESSCSEEEEIEHEWGELDKDADTIDEETGRIAVCNMDWDRITAQDLMVLFHSFLPPGGVLHSVTIYPSDFGLKRIAEEEKQGPTELTALQATDDQNQDEETLNEEQRETLRKYQLKRLKYFYAVLVFNSPKTANHVYKECDGLEYESSMNRLDLRFIPDGTTFDQKPREECSTLPDPSSYKPRLYRTKALTQVKVDLTWDETDPTRQELISAAHNGKLDESKLDRFLAASSEDEQDTDEVNGTESLEVEPISEKGAIEKYKSLLADLEKNEDAKKEEPTMEITWDLKLEQKAAEMVKEVAKANEHKTPFEQFLEKKKEKKKLKKIERKAKTEANNPDNSDDDQPFSDDDLPSDIDMNDAYFRSERNDSSSKTMKKRKSQTAMLQSDSDSGETKQEQAELELLMLEEDGDGGKKHFSLSSIANREQESKSKKKLKKHRGVDTKNDDDDFKMDVKDDRFSAIYTSHHYNVDPANPQFRPTQAMKALITEKIRRRASPEPEDKPVKVVEKKMDAELSMLVKSVKRKTNAVKNKKQK